MGDHEARGDDFEKKAEKKLSGWGLFSSKYEDAADLFDKAANSFKLAKNCERSWLPCPDPPSPPRLPFTFSPIGYDESLGGLAARSVGRSGVRIATCLVWQTSGWVGSGVDLGLRIYGRAA
jgi:hypothetical protein